MPDTNFQPLLCLIFICKIDSLKSKMIVSEETEKKLNIWGIRP